MRLFNTLCLEITATCNRKCDFCPVAYNTRPDERMKYQLMRKALAELGELDYRGRVELYIYNEPAKDKEYLNLAITLVRQLAPKCCIMIATNGDYFKKCADLIRLFDLGLNQLLINCYSPGLYNRRRFWIDGLPPDISRCKSVYSGLSCNSKTVQLLDKSNEQEFGSGVFRLMNRAGNIPQFLPPTQAPLKRMCVKPFRLLNINWLGQALVCCQDYHGDMSYGNLADSSLIQLWNHPVMNRYRRSLLSKDRSLPLCRTCDCYAGAYSHNVDRSSGLCASKKEIESLWEHRKNPASNAGQGVDSV